MDEAKKKRAYTMSSKARAARARAGRIGGKIGGKIGGPRGGKARALQMWGEGRPESATVRIHKAVKIAFAEDCRRRGVTDMVAELSHAAEAHIAAHKKPMPTRG